MSESYLTVSEIADRLKVSRATAYRICHKIGYLKLGSGLRAPIRVPAEDYERWVRENHRDPVNE